MKNLAQVIKVLKKYDEIKALESFIGRCPATEPHTIENVRSWYLYYAADLRRLLKPFDDDENKVTVESVLEQILIEKEKNKDDD